MMRVLLSFCFLLLFCYHCFIVCAADSTRVSLKCEFESSLDLRLDETAPSSSQSPLRWNWNELCALIERTLSQLATQESWQLDVPLSFVVGNGRQAIQFHAYTTPPRSNHVDDSPSSSSKCDAEAAAASTDCSSESLSYSLLTEPKLVTSASKWLSAFTFLRMIEDLQQKHAATCDTSSSSVSASSNKCVRFMSLNDPTWSWIPWWTRSSSDARSRIQLHHHLRHTDGIGFTPNITLFGSPNNAFPSLCSTDPEVPLQTCVRYAYEHEFGEFAPLHLACPDVCEPTPLHYPHIEPGLGFHYSQAHYDMLQYIAELANDGEEWDATFHRLVREPFQLKSASYVFPTLKNPDLGSGAFLNAIDLARFLQTMSNREGLSPDLYAELFSPSTPLVADRGFWWHVSNHSRNWHYCMGNWLICDDIITNPASCKRNNDANAARWHHSVGLTGTFPVLDETSGTFLIVSQLKMTLPFAMSRAVQLFEHLQPWIEQQLAVQPIQQTSNQ